MNGTILRRIKEMTIDKFVIENEQPEGAGCIYALARNVVKGHKVCGGKKLRFVIPYKLYFMMGVFLYITGITNLYLHGYEGKVFRNAIDFAYIMSVLVLSVSHINYGESMEKIGLEIDRWWTYNYLEKDSFHLKSKAERSVKIINRFCYNYSVIFAIGYVTVPFVKYFINGMTRPADMLVVEGLPEAPWLYFEIIIGGIAMSRGIFDTLYDITYFLSVATMEVAQIRLIGRAFISINDRVLKIMNYCQINCSNLETHDELVANEIKTCIIHYQALYRQVKLFYKAFVPTVNHFYYVGCLCFIGLGVLLMKIDGNHVILIQIGLGSAFVVFIQFIYSSVNDMIRDEIDKLRSTVSSSEWYDMPIRSQKTIHIMQTMLMNSPKLKTLFGSEVTTEFYGKVLNAAYYYITTLLSTELN